MRNLKFGDGFLAIRVDQKITAEGKINNKLIQENGLCKVISK